MTRSSQADEPAGAGAAWTADRFLDQWGLQASQAGALPSSAKRFPDGAQRGRRGSGTPAGRTNLALIASGVDAHAA
jgi:hypothetical protein